MVGSEPVMSYSLADGNCRTFMKCNGNGGYGVPFCCRQEYYYNPQTGQCKRVKDPLDPCMKAECPSGYKQGRFRLKYDTLNTINVVH